MSVSDLVLHGEIDRLADGVATGVWEGTTGGELARILIAQDGLETANELEGFVRKRASDPAELAIAWFHLYGFARLVDDREQANSALQQLNAFPEVASRLFHKGVPAPLPLLDATTSPQSSQSSGSARGAFSVQIGAFGARDNAERLAGAQRKRGFTVEVVPVASGGKTLHTVRVGNFGSQNEATAFGARYYGKEGKDFRVVRR